MPVASDVFVAADVLAAAPSHAQAPAAAPRRRLLQPARVFDGEAMHEGWVVVVRGESHRGGRAAGGLAVPAGAERVALPGLTLLPGLIEGHSHLLLHPYNETTWNDQVLRESLAYRVARATVERARHADGRHHDGPRSRHRRRRLRRRRSEAVDRRRHHPRPAHARGGPAMVATGSYGPKGFAPELTVPQGAEEADGIEGVTRVARNQIGHGVDFVKIYADYRWGPNGEARPTFTLEEIAAIVAVAKSSGRSVVAHAGTPEGMRRAMMGGVETIEHGDGGTPEIWELMVEKSVAYCPTLAAPAMPPRSTPGWKKGSEPEPARLREKRAHVQGGAEGRREDVLRRRRRRLPARRQRARARA